ncbi:MAG: prepilin-type N-terminal cleavage/methylation domain-containing protein [Candidatus Falkowbacteria bacterium]
MKKRGGAFSLVEILVAIFVIGLLAAVAMAGFSSMRNQSLDLQRLHDIRQIQTSLDRYASDSGGVYPNKLEIGKPLVSPNGSTTYMQKVPSSPSPRAIGSCPDRDYTYVPTSNGHSYLMTYCLISGNAQFAKGDCHAMPGLQCVQNKVCSCTDKQKYCCGYCDVGSICGGGQLFKKNYAQSEKAYYDLVVMPSGCNFDKTSDPSCSGVDSGRKNWSDGIVIVDPASELYDGLANTNQLLNQGGDRSADKYPAAKYCSDLEFNLGKNQFADWYLPSEKELDELYKATKLATPSAGYFAPGYYWSSTQISASQVSVQDFNDMGGSLSNKTKDSFNYLRCIRH